MSSEIRSPLPTLHTWCGLLLVCAFLYPAPGSAEHSQRHQLDALTIQTPPPGIQDRWPIYKTTRYLKIEEYDIHLLGTETVSDWFMLESYDLVRNMVASLRDPVDRRRFAGHRAFLVTDADPAISANGLRNTGGRGFSLFNEALACAEAVDTLYPDKEPFYRAWNTPVHEFGHSIEHTLGLEKRSDDLFSKKAANYNPKVRREYFAWAVQHWFASGPRGHGRESMPRWQYEYLASIFDSDNPWVPRCSEDRTGSDAQRPDVINESLVRQRALDQAQANVVEGRDLEELDLDTLVGTYKRNPVANDWHAGSISIDERDAGGKPTILRWRNEAGVSWRLFPDQEGLRTGEENPYYATNPEQGRHFRISTTEANLASKVVGFWFQGELYLKAPARE